MTKYGINHGEIEWDFEDDGNLLDMTEPMSFNFEIDYNIYPGEKRTYWYPGSAPEIELIFELKHYEPLSSQVAGANRHIPSAEDQDRIVSYIESREDLMDRIRDRVRDTEESKYENRY